MKIHCVKVNDHYVVATPSVDLCEKMRMVVNALASDLPSADNSPDGFTVPAVRGETIDVDSLVPSIQYIPYGGFSAKEIAIDHPRPIYRVNVTLTLCDALSELSRTIRENLLDSR